jgi:hypothetical protein
MRSPGRAGRLHMTLFFRIALMANKLFQKHLRLNGSVGKPQKVGVVE